MKFWGSAFVVNEALRRLITARFIGFGQAEAGADLELRRR